MSIFRDRQVKFFSLFIVLYITLLFGVSAWFCQAQIAASKSIYLEHDRAVVSALLEQGVSKEVIANAIFSTDVSTVGIDFLNSLGINQNTQNDFLPHFSQFQHHFWLMALGLCLCMAIILGIGIVSFLQIRKKLYQQAEVIIENYINNDYSRHLPQDSEGEIFHLFGLVERLATKLKQNIVLLSAARRQKKKSRRKADTFSRAISKSGGFDFQSRRFFLQFTTTLTP